MDVRDERVCTVVGSASNPNGVGWKNAVGTIVALIAKGLGEMGATMADVRRVCCAVAGVDNPKYRERLSHQLKDAMSGPKVVVVSDALAALTAGTKGAPGVALIAGTGSIALGDAGDGEEVRAGGYGYLIGDEGSGFDIGRKGLMAAIAAAENRGEPTKLWEKAEEKFSVSSPIQLVPIIYGSDKPVTAVASFAPSVLDLANYDAVANGILVEAVSHHLRLIKAVASLMTHDEGSDASRPLRVVLAGGLYTSNDVLFDRLIRANQNYEFVRSRFSAAAGAALRSLIAEVHPGEEQRALSQVWLEIMDKASSFSLDHEEYH